MYPDIIPLLSYVIHLHLHHTCIHHVCTMRNPCLLTSSPNPNSIFRLFLILLDPKSFQTALDSITWLPGHVLSIHCRLIIILPYICPLILTLVQSLSTLSYYNIYDHSHMMHYMIWYHEIWNRVEETRLVISTRYFAYKFTLVVLLVFGLVVAITTWLIVLQTSFNLYLHN